MVLFASSTGYVRSSKHWGITTTAIFFVNIRTFTDQLSLVLFSLYRLIFFLYRWEEENLGQKCWGTTSSLNPSCFFSSHTSSFVSRQEKTVKLTWLNVENKTFRAFLLLFWQLFHFFISKSRFYLMGRSFSTAVDHTNCDQKVMGLNPTRCWVRSFFFGLHLSRCNLPLADALPEIVLNTNTPTPWHSYPDTHSIKILRHQERFYSIG